MNRAFAGVAGTTVTVNLIEPGTLYGDRVNEFNLRFAKIVRFGRTRTDIGVDLNNLFNTHYATGFNTTYQFLTDNNPRPSGWSTPTSLVNPRFVRLNFTVNF